MRKKFKLLKVKKYIIPIFFTVFFIISFNLLLNKNCLSLSKLIKSYNDFGYSNIKQCYITDIKNLVIKKFPSLFPILADLKRHYISKYNKDLLDLNNPNDYKKKQDELYSELILLEKKGIKGILNDSKFIYKAKSNNYNKTYQTYSRQNKDNLNSKFYDKVNLIPINKNNQPSLAWKHVSLNPNKKNKNWSQTVEISPIFFQGKIFYVSANNKLIALNAINGKLLWIKELLHNPSRRGFLLEKDIFGNEYLYIGIGSNMYKLNAENGDLIKNFGLKGYIKNSTTKFSPVIYQNNLIIVSNNSILAYDKDLGKKIFSINIFKKKNFSGGLPWGGVALDENIGVIYFTTGNPRPKVVGIKRSGPNDGSNSLIAIDLNKKKIIWQFKEIYHDLWNLDIAYPPILTSINVENKFFDVVIVLTKVGNLIMLERSTGKPIYDIEFAKVPKSIIPAEITSPYQTVITKPEPITKFDWNLNDVSQIKNKKEIKKIINNPNDYEYGYFLPPFPNKAYLFKAEGPIWYGGAINKNTQKLYQTVNQTPTIIRPHLKSLWPHSKIKKKLKKKYKLYRSKCSSCHGANRNGKYIVGKEAKNKGIEIKVIPSLVGFYLFNDLEKKIKNYENYKVKHKEKFINKEDYKKINILFNEWDHDLIKNKKIQLVESSSFFVDKDKNFLVNYPHGEIVSYDLPSGKIDWRIPFGYENDKNVGTFIMGGLCLSNDGTLFATGTPDKKVYAFNSKNGKEIWSYQMELAGNAPPILYEHNGKKYLSVMTSGGYSFKYPDRGSILYTFSLN